MTILINYYNLTPQCNLDLSRSKIKSIPEGLKVGANLDLSDTPITSLPEGLKVGGFLNLRFCTELTSLPKGLEVVGDLYVENTELKKYTDKELTEMVKPGFIGRIRKI